MQYTFENLNNIGKFGAAHALSSDGSTFAISDTYNSNSISNKVYIYEIISGVGWVRKYELAISENLSYNPEFGSNILFNKNGDRLIISAQKYNNKGAVYIFSKDNNGWQQTQKIYIDSLDNNSNFGSIIDISSDASLIAVSCHSFDNSKGRVFVYTYNGSTYTLKTTLSDALSQNFDFFGRSLALNDLGNVLAISAPGKNSGIGLIYIYKLAGNSFIETQRLYSLEPKIFFGISIDINQNGNLIFVSNSKDYKIDIYKSLTNGLYFYSNSITYASNDFNEIKIKSIDNGKSLYIKDTKNLQLFKIKDNSNYTKVEDYKLENFDNTFSIYDNGDFSIGYYDKNNNGEVILYRLKNDLKVYTGTNQRNPSLSLKLEAVPNKALEDIYLENQDVLWASYNLDTKTFSGSGSYDLNFKNLNAFTVDFERHTSGELNTPSLYYKEYTGDVLFSCFNPVQVDCSDAMCLICSEGMKMMREQKRSIEVPYNYNIGRTYGSKIDTFTSIQKGYETVLLNEKFKSFCCSCDCTPPTSGDLEADPTIDDLTFSGLESVFFADTERIDLIKRKYDVNWYSGQIYFNNFSEGDSIKFKQYQFDFNKAHQILHKTSPEHEEIIENFIYSDVKTGLSYFKSKNDLINKINNKLNINHYTWVPLKHSKFPRYIYSPLLKASEGAQNESGEAIDLTSMNSGKLGACSIKLDFGPKRQINTYLVPKVISLQVSKDGVNWDNIVTSQDVQPINVYLKNNKALGPDILYDDIENVSYTYEKTVPVGSEDEKLPKEKTGDLGNLLIGLLSGNSNIDCKKNIESGIIQCIPAVGQSGECCGFGYLDFYLSCKSLEASEGEPELPSEEDQEPQKGSPEKKIEIKVNKFKLGFWDYLSNDDNFDLNNDFNPNVKNPSLSKSSTSLVLAKYPDIKGIKNTSVDNCLSSLNSNTDYGSSSLSLSVNDDFCEKLNYFSIPYINCPNGFTKNTVSIQGRVCYDCIPPSSSSRGLTSTTTTTRAPSASSRSSSSLRISSSSRSSSSFMSSVSSSSSFNRYESCTSINVNSEVVGSSTSFGSCENDTLEGFLIEAIYVHNPSLGNGICNGQVSCPVGGGYDTYYDSSSSKYCCCHCEDPNNQCRCADETQYPCCPTISSSSFSSSSRRSSSSSSSRSSNTTTTTTTTPVPSSSSIDLLEQYNCQMENKIGIRYLTSLVNNDAVWPSSATCSEDSFYIVDYNTGDNTIIATVSNNSYEKYKGGGIYFFTGIGDPNMTINQPMNSVYNSMQFQQHSKITMDSIDTNGTYLTAGFLNKNRDTMFCQYSYTMFPQNAQTGQKTFILTGSGINANDWKFHQFIDSNLRIQREFAGQIMHDAFRPTHLNKEGNLLAVTAYSDDWDVASEDPYNPRGAVGAIYVFEKGINGIWQDVQKIVPNDIVSGDYFGEIAAIFSPDSKNLFAGTRRKHDYSGVIYIFENNQGIWNETAKITGEKISGYFGFGGISFHPSGNIFCTTDFNLDTRKSTIFLYTGSGSNWKIGQEIVPCPQGKQEPFYGIKDPRDNVIYCAPKFNKDGNMFIVSDANANLGNNGDRPNQAGAIYLFTGNTNNWKQAHVYQGYHMWHGLVGSNFCGTNNIIVGGNAPPNIAVERSGYLFRVELL